jgi:hypothetical protein
VARAWASGIFHVVFVSLITAVAFSAGQYYVLALPVVVVAVVALGLRTGVRVDSKVLTVQNWASRKLIPLEDVSGFDFVDLSSSRFRWSVLQLSVRAMPSAAWRCPRVRTNRGEIVELQALACPHDESVLGTSVAETRLAALERWVQAHGPAQPSA